MSLPSLLKERTTLRPSPLGPTGMGTGKGGVEGSTSVGDLTPERRPRRGAPRTRRGVALERRPSGPTPPVLHVGVACGRRPVPARENLGRNPPPTTRTNQHTHKDTRVPGRPDGQVLARTLVYGVAPTKDEDDGVRLDD